MEGRNFHTALVGGFRKKDVVSFLAEDKRRQEELLQALQGQLEQAEKQLAGGRAERDDALERAAALGKQLAEAQEARAAQQEELAHAREEAARLESLLEEAQARQQALEARLRQAEQEGEELRARAARLEESIPAQPPVDAQELQALRAELQAQRERARSLDAPPGQQPQSRAQPAESLDQLWALCGKMERTLSQMERLLDGPYRMTCYPEPMEARSQPEESCPMTEGDFCPAQPAAASMPPEDPLSAPSVKSLLRRIRGK